MSAASRFDDLDRRVFALAIPALGALAVEPLYVLVDTAIVGHLGTTPLGGLALASTALHLGSTQTFDLDASDYSNGALWQEIGGNQGAIYTYMGGTTQTLNLATQNYADLGYWKPVKETTYIPQGINLTESNSTTVGMIIVMNDVRGGVEASIV
ncbi:MAG: repeat-containing protein, partial [Acidimicrobiales bacterium]|nr:repeat-containing protein [Acidimicrobiales bacterium]